MLPSRVRGASGSRVATTSNTVVVTTSAPTAAQNHHFCVSDGGSPVTGAGRWSPRAPARPAVVLAERSAAAAAAARRARPAPGSQPQRGRRGESEPAPARALGPGARARPEPREEEGQGRTGWSLARTSGLLGRRELARFRLPLPGRRLEIPAHSVTLEEHRDLLVGDAAVRADGLVDALELIFALLLQAENPQFPCRCLPRCASGSPATPDSRSRCRRSGETRPRGHRALRRPRAACSERRPERPGRWARSQAPLVEAQPARPAPERAKDSDDEVDGECFHVVPPTPPAAPRSTRGTAATA